VEPSAWDVAGVVLKALTYAATFGAAGGAFFLAYSDPLLIEPERRQTRRQIGWMIAAAVLSTLVRIPLTAGSMGDGFSGVSDPGLNALVLAGGEGRATAIRVIALILEGAALRWLSTPAPAASLAAAFAATSFAWVGHPHGVRVPAMAPLAVGVHLLAIAFWLGALLPLVALSRSPDPRRAARAAQRFGAAAVPVVAALVAAGAGLACLLLGSASQLWTSPYGRALALKIGLVAGLLTAAALNKLRWTPRLALGDLQARAGLRRSIWIEIGLGAAILLTTATLTTLLSPAKL
jgi:putative copper export protein